MNPTTPTTDREFVPRPVKQRTRITKPVRETYRADEANLFVSKDTAVRSLTSASTEMIKLITDNIHVHTLVDKKGVHISATCEQLKLEFIYTDYTGECVL